MAAGTARTRTLEPAAACRELLWRVRLSRLELEMTPRREFRRPEWIGSLLRGALGHALARLDERNGTSVYEELYRARGLLPVGGGEVPAPYWFEWAPGLPLRFAPSQPWRVRLVLVGRAGHRIPEIAAALGEALDAGLGELRVPHDFEILRYDCGETGAGLPLARLPNPLDGAPADCIELEAVTPLRLGRTPKEARRPGAERLIRAAWRRARLLATTWCDCPPEFFPASLPGRWSDEVQLEWLDHRWVALERISSRQRRRLPAGGCIGRLRLSGQLGRLRPVLRAAAWLHAGRHASLGHGRLVASGALGRAREQLFTAA